MAPKIDPETPIGEGSVIVRVGANSIRCPKGPAAQIYPVVQLIWPAGEEHPNPQGELFLRWQDKLDATKPSKSPSPKYIGLVTGDGQQWIGYRVSDKDREIFESLRKKWGMWFLLVRRQGEETDQYWTFFNDGGHFPGAIVSRLDEYVQHSDADDLRDRLVSAWHDTVDYMRKNHPQFVPTEDVILRRLVTLKRMPGLLEELGGGPLPWKPKEMEYWGKADLKAHDEVVALYLRIIGVLKDSATDKTVPDKFRHECGKMYGLLRRAKIFEITPESYVELHLQVDRYVTEEIAHLTFHDPRDPKVEIPEAEGLLLYRRQMEACETLPFPEKLPFDVCWFAMAGPVVISDMQAETRGLKDGNRYMLIGILVTEDNEHHELLLSNSSRRRGEYVDTNLHIATHRVEEESSWQHTFCLAPFILHSLVDAVNDHQTTIVAQRRLSIHNQGQIKKKFLDLGLKKEVPPPFYTVHLRDKVITEVIKGHGAGALRAKYSHRFDVRGHWCFKIYRGMMPMDAELELHLDKLHYNIFKSRELDDETTEALMERGQPPRLDNEWIAVKKFWRNSFVKGPEDGPYIPSTRRATKGVLAFDNEEASEQNSSCV